MNDTDLEEALNHDARVPAEFKLGTAAAASDPDVETPSPVIGPSDLVAACHEAEVALRAATELIAWAVQRAYDRSKANDNQPYMQLAAVLDARNAELKRAALTLGLVANDASRL